MNFKKKLPKKTKIAVNLITSFLMCGGSFNSASASDLKSEVSNVVNVKSNTNDDILKKDVSKDEIKDLSAPKDSKNVSNSNESNDDFSNPENFDDSGKKVSIFSKYNPFSNSIKLLKKASKFIPNPTKMLKKFAHGVLFWGYSEDFARLDSLKSIFDIEDVTLPLDIGGEKPLNLYGHVFAPKNGKYDTVCICFGSDMSTSSLMVTEDSCRNILYVCIDYPGFGKSEYTYLDKDVMLKFDDTVYDYVCNRYSDKKLISLGFSLGGFGASYMAQKEKISEIYLVSPVYVGCIMGQSLSDNLFGFDLNFIENLENANHKCKVHITSGDMTDFLSLYHSLIYYYYYELDSSLDDNEKIKQCISLLGKNKNLDLSYEIYKLYNHWNIREKAIKEISEKLLPLKVAINESCAEKQVGK